MPNSNGTTTTNPTQGVPNSNGINSNAQQIPINHGTATAGMDMPQGYHHGQQQQQPGYASPSSGGGGVGGGGRQQFSPHFQGFGFDPDIDDMFNDAGLRGHLRGMRDPFGTFGSRKRSGNKNPLHSVSSYYDDDDADFPQFGSLGRRRAGGAASGAGNPLAGDGMQRDDFFERLPPEFRQFIPEGFGIRRGGSGSGVSSGAPESPRVQIPQPQFYQTYVQPATNPPNSPPVQTRTVCDAAIQTEDPSAGSNRSEVDGHVNPESLNQHGLRNTVDMGVKAPAEGEGTNSRSHSAPPQQQEPIYPHEVPIQQHQPAYNSQGTGTQRNTPPPAQQQRQFPPSQQPPQFQKAYYPPPNQPQQPAAPQTPGGSYIRTIPIFVEGRSEPLINHKDIPQAEAQPTQAFAQAKASSAHPPQQPQQQHHQPAPQPQQQHQAPQHHANRPTPINTQQQPTAQQQKGPPPATPHTMDSINKIQDIQRDVLNLMTEVEKFGGTRQGKEYAYLDEMLTRNLLKLDTIDTQGKESIRLARKEAIKCIQASINVLEAKAEENAKTAQPEEAVIEDGPAPAADAGQNPIDEQQPIDVSNVHEPIPLPPPDSLKSTGSSETVPAAATDATAAAESKETSASSETKETPDATTTTTTVTKSGSGSSTKGSETVAEGKTE